MRRAHTLANWYARRGEHTALVAHYDDGIVGYLCVAEETQNRFQEKLADYIIESARSSDGFCGVVILDGIDREEACCVIHDTVGDLRVQDNRLMDDNTIELFAGVIDRITRK